MRARTRRRVACRTVRCLLRWLHVPGGSTRVVSVSLCPRATLTVLVGVWWQAAAASSAAVVPEERATLRGAARSRRFTEVSEFPELAGKYQAQGLIGQGTFSQVHLGVRCPEYHPPGYDAGVCVCVCRSSLTHTLSRAFTGVPSLPARTRARGGYAFACRAATEPQQVALKRLTRMSEPGRKLNEAEMLMSLGGALRRAADARERQHTRASGLSERANERTNER